MAHDRIIQLISVFVLVISASATGFILPSILKDSEEHVLRYTNIAVDGAPPWVAIGTAIGALRGIVVDILWMKVHIMQEEGLFFEVMADAELITKLQPRFAQVWAFHGHNMAYNISVATNTEEERWEWVNAGIRLVRNEGIRYNPNTMLLYKELAFWFAHKLENNADDAHLYYKTQLCKEWHNLLGPPPIDYQARIAWIQQIAEAPDSLSEAERRVPGTKELVALLEEELSKYGNGERFKLNKRFLTFFSEWRALRDQSGYAKILGWDKQILEQAPIFAAFEEIVTNLDHQKQGNILMNYLRKKILKDEYNMDPQIMYELTRDLGPIDWRHPQAHALYWAWLGSKKGEGRVREEDVYHSLNTDRLVAQAMQGLARSGRISYDPFSNQLPGRFPEPRWIDTIDKTFERLYIKYNDTRGGGGESFIGFIENFLSYAVREWYRAGEHEKAKKLYARLDSLFGRGARIKNNKYARDLDVFVREQTRGHYEDQPFLAPSEVAASLRYAFRVGVGRDNREIWDDAMKFASDVTQFFKGNESNNYVTKFGSGRMKDLIGQLEQSASVAFEQIMTDPTLEIRERAVIWSKVDQFNEQLRPRMYDRIKPYLEEQFKQNALSQRFSYDEMFPPPPRLEEYRQLMAQERQRQNAENQNRGRDEIRRSGN
ncbi:MAG: hypothetical protein O7G85_17435 [Planctomycetota bacterium]|nr:hypothetical protein [Planctomycetota bacterium]